MTEFTVERDGIKIYCVLDKPKPDKCPVVIMHHGFGGSPGFGEDTLFGEISARLLRSGIASVRFDFSGHGQSGGRYEDVNLYGEICDAMAVLEYVKELDFVTEVYLLGHSQGGVVAGMLAGYYADIVKKLVLLAPAAVLKEDAQRGRCFDAQYDTDHIPDTVYVNGRAMRGRFFRIAKLLPIYEVTGQFKNPALIVGGLRDGIVSVGSLEKYKDVLENGSLALYENIDHGMSGEDKEEMLDRMIAFLTE